MKRRRLLFNTMEIDLESLMYIEALEDGLSVSFSRNTIYYSIDEAKTWASLFPNRTTPVINAGCKIYFKAGNLTPSSSNGIGTFTINKKCKAGGSIMSLALEPLKGYQFHKLFYNCTNLIEVSENFLPATTLASRCYSNMFYGCTSLISAPELPATTLSEYCYYNMFKNCTSLTTAPELPAITLATSCYSSMFSGCTGLTQAPELPVTTLANACYLSMFEDCPRIDFIKMHATDISATACLYNWVYGVASTGIFVKNKDATWDVVGSSGVPTGWVVKKDNEAIKQINYYKEVTINKAYDVIGCDTSTTIEYTAIVDGIAYDGTVLENITITDYAESDVFEQNTSNNAITRTIYLTLGNIILSTTILQGPWQNPDTSYTYFKALENNFSVVFSGKIKYLVEGESKWTYKQSRPLNKGEKIYVLGMLYDGYSGSSGIGTFRLINKGIVGGNSNALISVFNNTLQGYQFYRLFYNCTNLIEVSENFLPATTLKQQCYAHMFYKCTSLVIAPELPATNIAFLCYSYMFSGCTRLTTAPELPATTLANYCYSGMFSGCANLNYIKMLATDISATDCLSSWVYNVSPTGTFVKNVDATWDVVGSSGVPAGWEIDFNFTITECTLLSIIANDVSARNTSTTITYTALVNGIDEFGNTVTNKVITKTVESDPFPQNTSETETVTRTISYTYMGVTATTTITQGVWVNQKYTLNLNDLWQSSTVTNPDSSLYDGVYESFSNKGVNNSAAIAYITINGYSNFKFYIRSYGESKWDYVMVSQLDLTITYNTSYNSTGLVKAHTRLKSTSGTALSNYTLVEFTDIDEGEHTITVLYRKDSSGNSGDDKGYILIPINQ